MAVKPVGPTYRRRQALATRAAVTEAARRLFAAHGYVATSIQAIADTADIPVQTIYSAFGSKPAILEEIRRKWIFDADVEVLYARALASPESRDRLRLAAHWTRRQFQLGHDVIAVYQEAARSDPRVAAVWRQALAGREAAVAELLQSLRSDLRAGLTPGEALDRYVACTLPETYRTLVLERGWSPDQYQRWLTELLLAQLLRE